MSVRPYQSDTLRSPHPTRLLHDRPHPSPETSWVTTYLTVIEVKGPLCYLRSVRRTSLIGAYERAPGPRKGFLLVPTPKHEKSFFTRKEFFSNRTITGSTYSSEADMGFFRLFHRPFPCADGRESRLTPLRPATEHSSGSPAPSLPPVFPSQVPETGTPRSRF